MGEEVFRRLRRSSEEKVVVGIRTMEKRLLIGPRGTVVGLRR